MPIAKIWSTEAYLSIDEWTKKIWCAERNLQTDGWTGRHIKWNTTQSLNEGNSSSCNDTNETWESYNKWNKPDTEKKNCIIPLLLGIQQ